MGEVVGSVTSSGEPWREENERRMRGRCVGCGRAQRECVCAFRLVATPDPGGGANPTFANGWGDEVEVLGGDSAAAASLCRRLRVERYALAAQRSAQAFSVTDPPRKQAARSVEIALALVDELDAWAASEVVADGR